MSSYFVKKLQPKSSLTAEVPASKSILNRALVLSALSKGEVRLKCGSCAEDSEAMINCLNALGIQVCKEKDGLLVKGCSGEIPNRSASLNAQSAGTAARFLPPVLAFCKGEYHFYSSEQMARRPMEHLKLLEDMGVHFAFEKEPYHFPFTLRSDGISVDDASVNAETSTQYASGILLAATCKPPFTVRLTGSRKSGSYISMTKKMLVQFGVKIKENDESIKVCSRVACVDSYIVEGDLSAACYFFAIALLLKCKVFVKNITMQSLQGDVQFLKLLLERGVKFTQTDGGLSADGSEVKSFEGFELDISDFSDQALTVAALAPFANSASRLKNLGHIRSQECDRVEAIRYNLENLGVKVSVHDDDIEIFPSAVQGGVIKTFNDHRVAMAFTLIGLKTGNITIENPDCCKKTFPDYFKVIESFYHF